jgi:acyl-CoA synthetase (AMP-forming)/AMP-acid ligase II
VGEVEEFYENYTGPSATLSHLPAETLLDVLRFRAEVQPDATAFVHLLDGESEEQRISYAELWLRSKDLAQALIPLRPEGRRVLMMFESGIDYIVALFGIWLSDATAVPSFPPVGSRALERLGIVAANAEPDIILTSQRFTRLRDRVHAVLPGHREVPHWMDMDALANPAQGRYVLPVIEPERIALIQYTSGSTSEPKGVLLSHSNLLSNCSSASEWMGGARPRVGCSWLPPYHDMGLMGGILQPIYEGFPTVLLSPAHFVQQPLRWLRALSNYQVSVSIAPNFAFDLCVETVRDEELANLDLSFLKEVYCGAEPVRWSTLQRFAERFACTGFTTRAFSPCYGLAEATVFVTGKPVDSAPISVRVDREALAAGRLMPVGRGHENALMLVSSGHAAPGHLVLIVDADTQNVLADGKVGEIWVQGGNIGSGYWRNSELTAARFQARLASLPGEFLRTGDIGARINGELFVTGRIKDLIIIAGRNLYPQDLELCVQQADPRLRANGIVAVGIDDGDQERLAIVAEIKRSVKLATSDLEALRQVITATLVATFGVAPSLVHFGPVGTVPLTTSGKPQRQATKLSLMAGSLPAYVPRSR